LFWSGGERDKIKYEMRGEGDETESKKVLDPTGLSDFRGAVFIGKDLNVCTALMHCRDIIMI